MPSVSYAEALSRGVQDALSRDDRVVLIGGRFGGLDTPRAPFEPLFRDFADRIVEHPVSELAVAGVTAGAAMMGLRPVFDVRTASFAFQAFAQIVNEAANVHYQSGGAVTVPAVYHLLAGIRGSGGPQHSHAPQAMFWNTPGLQIMLPSSPADVYGLVRWAMLHSNSPTIFLDHPLLMDETGDVDWDSPPIPFGRARIARAGADVTVVATSIMVNRALLAAGTLAADHGLDVEVIDPRTLAPLDEDTIVQSVRKTGHLVVADESHRSCGAAAEISSRVVERAFDALRSAPVRVATPDVHIPFSPGLEAHVVPSADQVVAACLAASGRTATGAR